MNEREVVVNGVRLHLVEDGPDAGPLVILLHGFPEYWASFERQMGPLAASGYRVLAPDQRGYNLSEKPIGVAAYSLDVLADDVAALVDESGRSQVTLVGHDWGGAVAWWLAATRPELLRRLVILNCPFHTDLASAMRRSRRQLRRSWYVFFFQVPRVPEMLAVLRRGWLGRNLLTSAHRPGAITEHELDRYVAAWSQPGAATGMLNWYRASFRARPRRSSASRVTVPTLLIWGGRDPVLGTELAEASLARCEDGRLEVLEKAGHFPHHDEPDRVTELILGFLGEDAPPP